jgi:CHAT domain-containing protein/Flp pilus assembly protein TadD
MKNVLLQLLAILSFWGLQANKSYGQEKLSEGEKLLTQAQALAAQQKFDSAILICEKALQVAEKEKVKQDTTLAKAYLNLGLNYFNKQNVESFAKAETNLLKGKDLLDKSGVVLDKKTNESILYLDVLKKLEQVYYYSSQIQKQFAQNEQIRDIQRKFFGENSKEYANSLTGFGVALIAVGDLEQAKKVLPQAAATLKTIVGENSREYSIALYYLGSVYYYTKDFVKAEPIFIQLAAKKLPDEANAYVSLANVYNELGSEVKAARWYVKALNIAGENTEPYSNSWTGLATIYTDLGQYEQGEIACLKAAKTVKAMFGENNINYINILTNLGVSYVGQGKLSLAVKTYQDALNILKEMGLETNLKHFETSIHNHLGYVYTQQRRYAEAIPMFKQAMSSYQALTNKSNQSISANLISLQSLKKDLKKAIFYYHLLPNSLTTVLQNDFIYLSELEKAALYRRERTNIDYLQSFAIYAQKEGKNKNFPQSSLDSLKAIAFDNRLVMKGILLQSSQKMKTNILNSQDSSLIKLFGKWEKQKQQVMEYEKLSVADKAKNKINIDSLAEATNSIEKQLSKKSENFASITDKRKYTWQNIQQALKPNEVAVEMVRISKFGVEKVLTDSSDTEHFKAKGFYPKYDRYGLTDTTYYAALLISKDTKDAPELVILENGNDLEDKHIKNYLKNIASPKNTDTDKVSYAAFWQKIAQSATLTNLKGENKKIFVSLDGTYHKLNLGTLYNPATKKYLADEFTIQQLTNLKEIITTQDKAITPTKDMLLLGFPNYNLDKAKRWEEAEKQRLERANKKQPAVAQVESFGIVGEDKDQKRAGIKNLDSLPNTREEVLEVEKIGKTKNYQAYTYLQNAALEETLKAANSPRVLHIATHGFFNEAAGNPLLNSGLYLTGANQTKSGKETLTVENILSGQKAEDGILTSQEAMNLNLDKTDLVVLSACQTGLGEVSNGEGVYGLQRAFIVAGSKAVLCSLWEVDDVVSFEFMKLFYENYLASNDKHKALKATQQQVQKIKPKYAHPYYWGSFVLIGN